MISEKKLLKRFTNRELHEIVEATIKGGGQLKDAPVLTRQELHRRETKKGKYARQ